jgi:N4-gp56 family major capsid protein
MVTLNVTLASDISNLIPVKYGKRVRDDAYLMSILGKFAGPEGSQSMMIERDDLTREAGDQIHFEVLSELYGAGVTGETTRAGGEEKWTAGRFSVSIDWLRHAVAFTEKANKEALINCIMRSGQKLSRWLAKRTDEDAFDEILSPGAATIETIYAGDNVTADSGLTSDSRFDLEAIEMLGLALRRKALPLEIRDPKGANAPVNCYGCFVDEVSLYWLFRDSAYRTLLQSTLPRTFDHPLLTGAVGMHNGVLIYPYSSITQGVRQGTPLRPEVQLVGTHGGGSSSLTVGADDGRNYTKHFPSSGYVTVQSDGNDAAQTIAYSSKTTYTFTLSGGTLTNARPAGTRVTLGYNRATVIGFGSELIARAWGMHPTPTTDVKDYGFEMGVGIKAVYGESVIEDSAGNVPNGILMAVYADPPHYAI